MDEIDIVMLGVAALIIWRAWKLNTIKPADIKPAASGVLGTTPTLNPATPKTSGDFARFDRSINLTSSMPVTPSTAPNVTTGDFSRLDRASAPASDEIDFGNPQSGW